MADPKQLSNLRVSALHANSTRVALVVHTVDASGDYVSPGAGSTQVSIKGILSADASTSLVDSTQNSLAVTIREGSAAGSTLVTVRQSTVGDLRAAVYQSTAADLNVTVAGYSTVVSVSTVGARVTQSTAADLNAAVVQGSTVWPVQIPSSQSVQVKNSTIGDLLASVQQNSTVWSVQIPSSQSVQVKNSTIGDLLASVQQNSTVWQVQIPSSQSVQVKNSTIGDLLASVQQNSTVWQTQAKIQDSSGVGPNILGTRPSTGAQGIAVRHVLNDLQSTCFSTIGNGATSATVVSSGASLRHKVFAYSITSTAQAVNTLTFASSLGNPIWHVAMQAFSSGISGANLAVTPPAWLFATESASPLVFKVTGTTGSYHLSFSYFSEA